MTDEQIEVLKDSVMKTYNNLNISTEEAVLAAIKMTIEQIKENNEN